MTINVNCSSIKGCLLGKTLDEVRQGIRKLEASERIMLEKVFESNRPPQSTIPENEQMLLQSLHTKLTTHEKSSIFSWFLHLFRGPWFKSIRIRLHEFKSSCELAQIITQQLKQPSNSTSQPTDNSRKPQQALTPNPPTRPLDMPVLKPCVPALQQNDPSITQCVKIAGFQSQLEKMIEGLSNGFDRLENAIIARQSNTNQMLHSLNSYIEKLKLAIKDIEKKVKSISVSEAEFDKEEIESFCLDLDKTSELSVELCVFLNSLKRMIRDREDLTIQSNHNNLDYDNDANAITESLQKIESDISNMFDEIRSKLTCASNPQFNPDNSRLQFNLEL